MEKNVKIIKIYWCQQKLRNLQKTITWRFYPLPWNAIIVNLIIKFSIESFIWCFNYICALLWSSKIWKVDKIAFLVIQ